MTPKQLIEAWRAKKGAKAMPDTVVDNSSRPVGLSRSTCERLVLRLLGLGVLSDDFHFTAFSVLHYVVTGARAHALESCRLRVDFEVSAAEGGAWGVDKEDGCDGSGSSRRAGKRGRLPGGDSSDYAGDGVGGVKGSGQGVQRGGGRRTATTAACTGVVGVGDDDSDGDCRGDRRGNGGRSSSSGAGRGKGKKRPRAGTAASGTRADDGDGWTGNGGGGEGVVDLCDDSDTDSSTMGGGAMLRNSERGSSECPASLKSSTKRSSLRGGRSSVVAGASGEGESQSGRSGVGGRGVEAGAGVDINDGGDGGGDVVGFGEDIYDDSDFEDLRAVKKVNSGRRKNKKGERRVVEEADS